MRVVRHRAVGGAHQALAELRDQESLPDEYFPEVAEIVAEIADAIVFLAGPAASYITGIVLPVAGGMAPGI